MQSKQLPVIIVGAALVVGFFLPWIDVAGAGGLSGWDIARSGHFSLFTRLIVAIVPIGGTAMVLAGLAGARASGVALGTGAAILGYTTYKVVYVFFKITGLGLWLVLAGAVAALVLGLAFRQRSAT
jgi:hypothetical protein